MGRPAGAAGFRVGLLVSAALAAPLPSCSSSGGQPDAPAQPKAVRASRLFVCAQDAAEIDVLDGTTLESIVRIPTGKGRGPHNVAVSPDGKQVWVTNADPTGIAQDEVLVLDPATAGIAQKVALDANAQIAHVLVTPDGKTAFVTGWGSSIVYRVDATTFARLSDVTLPRATSPHGIRFTEDGAFAYTANGGKSVSEIDAKAGKFVRSFTIEGGAIQVAVRGDVVWATVFDPPGIARVLRSTGAVTSWRLPSGTQGPAQLVVSGDGKKLYVAEQGNKMVYGTSLLVVDAETGAVLSRFETGRGAHGIALTQDERLAFVTGSFDASVAVIDLQLKNPDGTVGKSVQLGKTNNGPNGIAAWSP